MRKKAVIIQILLVSAITFAYEIDNFTDRYKPLPDARVAMNQEMQKRFKLASDSLKKKNKKNNPCNTKMLMDSLEEELGGWVIGSLEIFADKAKNIQRHTPLDNDNIYSDRSIKDKISGSIMSFAGLNSSINVDGHFIGVDKFGHFVDEGLEYYRAFKRKSSFNEGVREALDYGMQLEKGIHGQTTTGIMSYADLATNYSGLSFWMNIHEGPNPYFKCQNGEWNQVRMFDWADYVSPSWDEAINCSEFESTTLKNAVVGRAKALEDRDKKLGRSSRYQCPVDANACVKLKERYAGNAKMLLGPDCLAALPNPNPALVTTGQKPSGLSGFDNFSQAPKSGVSQQ